MERLARILFKVVWIVIDVEEVLNLIVVVIHDKAGQAVFVCILSKVFLVISNPPICLWRLSGVMLS